ncbi:calcium:cation antiporter, partial [Singulisphaera rosea]
MELEATSRHPDVPPFGSEPVRVYLLLLLIPVALVLDHAGANPILVFLTSAGAIVPLTVLIAKATENLSAHLGETTGGLLNATMGNVPEMIISISALRQGLQTVVKASITGSILGNILLILGISLLAGGARYNTQRYNAHLAGVHSKLLILAVIGLVVPALFHFTSGVETRISMEIAGILFITYLAGLAFTLITHRQLFVKKEADGPLVTDQKAWGVGKALAVLGATAVALSITSEALTGAVGPTAQTLHLNPVFA